MALPSNALTIMPKPAIPPKPLPMTAGAPSQGVGNAYGTTLTNSVGTMPPTSALPGIPGANTYNIGNPQGGYTKPPTNGLTAAGPYTANTVGTATGSAGAHTGTGTSVSGPPGGVPGTQWGHASSGPRPGEGTAWGAPQPPRSPPSIPGGTPGAVGADTSHVNSTPELDPFTGRPRTPGTTSFQGQGGGWNSDAINGVDPVHVTVDQSLLDGTNPYSTAAYNQATRNLDPQWQQQRAAFEQSMVNKGFTPGTPAYDGAMANFDRSKNDAYAQARDQSLQQGLGAQNQAFGQGLAQSQLANDLQKSKWSYETANSAATSSAIASQMQAELERERMAQQGNQFNQTFGASQDAQDWSHLLDIWNAGNSTIGANNAAQNQDFGRQQSLLNLIPGQGGNAPIDVTSPYNTQYNAGVNQANANQAQNNANNSTYLQLGTALMSMFCDRDAKVEIGPADDQKCLEALNSIPLVEFTYEGMERKHVGTYAQSFNQALGLEPHNKIALIDIMGAILGSIRALTAKVEAIEHGK